MTKYLLALTFAQRLRGLLWRKRTWLVPGRELVIVPCRGIHTFGMHEALDVALVSKSGVVLVARRNVPPRQFMRFPGAQIAIERFAASTEIPWYEPGDEVNVAVL